jgi:protein-tyrosine phosphatase
MTGQAGGTGSVVTSVLLVCRANQCRSPFAAAIATRLAVGTSLRFDSAGLLGGGRPMPQRGKRIGQERGFDFSAHRSRHIVLEELPLYDVILTMSRAQAREVLVDRMDVWPRVFTLKQFSRWITEHPRPSGVAIGPWLDEAAAHRDRRSLLGSSEHDDVADPVRASAAAWRTMADEVTSHLRVVVSGLATEQGAGQSPSTTLRS